MVFESHFRCGSSFIFRMFFRPEMGHGGHLRNICVCVLFGMWGNSFHEPTRPIGFSHRFRRKFPQQERQVIGAEARSEMIARWASRSKRLN